MEIVVATRNKGKVREIGRILNGLPIKLRSLDEFPDCPEVEETEPDFAGNAIHKAEAVAKHTGLSALADDSGLEVDALNGAPGVLSARYAGPGASDEDNVNKLLEAMKDINDKDRGARFVCVLALVVKDGPRMTITGTIEGKIGRKPMGTNGFGYDPVFYPKGLKKTFAEMKPEKKDSMSHRARALEKLASFLKEFQNI